jgi:hypothetical protein
MSYFSKNKSLAWILIILLLFNLAAIGTIIYKMYLPKPLSEQDGCRHSGDRKEHHCMKDLFKDELKLDAKQSQQFDIARVAYFDSLNSIHKLMSQKKLEIMNDMVKPQPDTSLLTKETQELGHMFIKARKLFVSHYFELSKICNDQQRKKLDSLFTDVICCQDEGKKQANCCGKDKEPNHKCPSHKE